MGINARITVTYYDNYKSMPLLTRLKIKQQTNYF
jgi:hypothetical protein